jgi:hypothetical protein
VQSRYRPSASVSVVEFTQWSESSAARSTVAPEIGRDPSDVFSKTTPDIQRAVLGIDAGAPAVESNVVDTTWTSKVAFALSQSVPEGHGAR